MRSRTIRAEPAPLVASGGTEGKLVYAVGDVHGRADLLEELLSKLREDADFAHVSRPTIVFLGDYIDRGPDSRGVIERILQLKESVAAEVVALKGNHEEAMLLFLADPEFGPLWARNGGVATLASYGVWAPATHAPEAWVRARDELHAALPDSHIRFLVELKLFHELGEYVFVHAGVRPGAPMSRQSERDLLWIRGDFLSVERPLERVVVHGHTPEPKPFSGVGRIGVDTGAYATGILTAARLLDDTRSFIQVSSRDVPARTSRPK